MIDRLGMVLLTALITLPSGQTGAEPPTLRQAWSLYHQGQVQAAREAAALRLTRAVSDVERRDAHLLLGALAWLRGDAWAAEDQIIDALSCDPGYRPDPLHLSPELQALVRRVARDRGDEVKRRSLARRSGRQTTAAASRPASGPTATATSPARPPPPPRTAPAAATTRSTPLYLAPLPFGVGQFLNGHRRKGLALLISETSLAVASIACLSAALALRDARGRYPEDVIGGARALNGIYLASAYSALALMIYGAVDGLFHRHRAAPSSRTVWLPGPSGSWGVGLRGGF